MNYEEKYKEALERAQQAVDKGYVSQNFVDDIFPGHKESRDERIKDEILRLVSISGNGNQYEEIRDWIAKLNDKDVLIKEQDALIKDQKELIKELGEYKTKYVRDSIIKISNCYDPDGNCCTNCPRRYYGAITATTTDTTEEKYDTTIRRADIRG